MNPKINDLITIFIIQLVITLPFYTANVYGLAISNVRVAKVTSNSATIEWGTDNASDGKVLYGKTTALGFKQRHDNFVANHTINVFGLDSDTAYFFAVESIDLAGNTAIDNNSNNFYTFKTTDITPPPQVMGLKAVSTTSDSVFLSWNNLSISDLSHYLVYRNRILIANTTTNSFNDTGLSSDTDFSYKVSAVDNSGNEGSQSDTFIAKTSAIDSKAPVISNVDALPITDTTARVAWLTDENATTIVLYGINKTDKTKSSSELVTNHTIVIDGLTKNLVFAFTVKSCDPSNNCANFSGSFTAGRDITPPFINLAIPRFVNRRVIDLIGSTEPFSSVTLFVNDMNIPKRSLGSSEIGSSGKFVFSQIQLQQDNIIKIAVVDKSGNKNQKIFEVSVDTEDPIVQLNEVPSLTSKLNLTISGSVNEQVLIKVFVDAKVNESAVPSKITGLNATEVGQNFVKLIWHESKDKDFSHYVVYRADASPIAITKPANFNLFIDALVDSGRSYTYHVSAVNALGREGPKSEPMTVTTLKGGAILNLKYPEVDIFEDFRKPVLVLNGTGSFNFGIRLNKGDGNYFIKLIFEDRAENSVIFDKSITLDTKKPDVKIISPPSGAFIFENVANEIDVIGKTKPNARVHLFVDRTPFSFFNKSLELSGLPNEVQNLPEAELDAKCRFNVAATSFCSTGADFSVSADEQGNFKFENVDLTAIFGGAARIKEVPVTEFRDVRLEEGKEAKTTTLVVIATDQVGQRGVATQNVRIGTCWSGNQSWDIIPLTQYQSPTLLSTERMAEGTETIYFYFNYSYIGRGTNARIKSVSISKACSTREIIDPRFNISCQLMPSGGNLKLLNPPDNTVSYSAVTLSRFPGMDGFLEKDWKDFLKAINKELTFPLKVRINYQHDTDNDGNLEMETQTTCEQVDYVVDSTIIDPRKFLPDWLLFDFVDFLQSSIKSLTQLQEQIDKLLDFVAVGCLASGGLNLVMQIYRRWTDFWIEKTYAIKDAIKFEEALGLFRLPQNQGNEEDCRTLIKNIKEKKGSFQLRYVNDIDLKKCFPASDYAWGLEANTYQLLRWSCDRVFGHAAPAAWTETKDDKDLLRRVESGEGCAVDQSVRGQPLRAESCTEFARKNPTYKAAAAFGPDAKCVLLKTKDKGQLIDEVYTIGNLVQGSNNLYEIKHINLQGALSGKTGYAVKKDEFNYLTAQSKSCAEICGVTNPVDFSGPGNTRFEVTKPKETKQPLTTKGKPFEPLAGCATVDTCRTVGANKKVYVGGEEKEVISIETRGYTSDCFYQGGSASVVSDSPSQRVECCCLNTKKGVPTQYYQPDDYDPLYDDINKQVHQPKKDSVTGLEPTNIGKDDFANMEWSYRYWKEKFEAKGTDGNIHTEYHPNRYIEGRDKPACFGQNNLLYEYVLQQPEKVLTVDPFRQHEASIQCVHLAGISNRIQFIKNLMTSMSTCLIQVRTTGRGDAGACKELFTQYLCGAIWQLIRWFVDGCTPIGFGIDFDAQSDTILTSVRAGFSSVYGSITDLQRSITQEYGNAKLNELLGTGEESIARKICLGAFGYDWEINVRNIVDAAYATPFATLVQPITRSREFLTVDPIKFAPKYEYRASWIINPGCDFERYDVYLTCVGRKQLDQYPNSINCGALGAPSIAYTGAFGTAQAYSQCDCINLPDERRGDLVFSGRLKQNVLEDKSFHKIIDANVRYDHLKFVLRPERKIQPNTKPNCFPTGYDDGVFYFPLIDRTAHDIFDCRVDPLSGTFFCGEGATFATRKGIAHFVNVKLDGNDITTKELVFSPGQSINIDAEIRKIGQDKCLRVTLDGTIVDVTGVTINGTFTYQLTIPALSLGQLERIVKPTHIEVRDAGSTNEKDKVITLRFYDEDGNGDINFLSEDKVEIENRPKIKIFDSEFFDSDGKLTITKEGAKIQVLGVTLPRAIDGRAVSIASATILVRSVLQPTEILKSQRRNVEIKLFHLKSDIDSYNNPEDCNPNDQVIFEGKPQERKASILLEVKAAQSGVIPKPVWRSINSRGDNSIRKGDTIEVTARIPNQLLIQKAELSLTGPPDSNYNNNFPQTKAESGNYIFLINVDELPLAGKYQGKVVATDRSGKTIDSLNFGFEVQCGGENNIYGFCKQLSQCIESNYITSGFPCIGATEEVFSTEVCCRT